MLSMSSLNVMKLFRIHSLFILVMSWQLMNFEKDISVVYSLRNEQKASAWLPWKLSKYKTMLYQETNSTVKLCNIQNWKFVFSHNILSANIAIS